MLLLLDSSVPIGPRHTFRRIANVDSSNHSEFEINSLSKLSLISGEVTILAILEDAESVYEVTFFPTGRSHPPCDSKNESCFSARLREAELMTLFPVFWRKVARDARNSTAPLRRQYVLSASQHDHLRG